MAADWKHENKKELCVWLALQIRKESASLRKGKVSRKMTRYFQHCDVKEVQDAGILELWLMKKIKNLSKKARWAWLQRCCERMLLSEKD